MPGLEYSLFSSVLVTILEIFRGDYRTLYRCSLVNRQFNGIASSVLYSNVIVPLSPFFPSDVIPQDQDGLSVSSSI